MSFFSVPDGPTYRASPQPLRACSPSCLNVQVAQSEDLQSIATLLVDSFHLDNRWLTWLTPLLRMGIYQDLRSRLISRPPHHVCLVAIQDHSLSGPGGQRSVSGTVELALRSLFPWHLAAPQYPYISNLAVNLPCRRQGVAQHLLLACERTAQEWGFNSLYLHVLENNQPARQLYCKAGYQLEKVDPFWLVDLPGQPQRLLLRKQLL